ncbi:nucleotide exchange factor GrpE [Candidatus Shapirobacteria bacterium CG09_land_8_20_14_0_10_38_17]|uniref:Protein GrpE n=1 Tax=Candidatus Shapirobacteria bacterium CG09_land_8_20_14_0_10_38_17 TaxID=1974884 RepID=A0A2H0WRN5_9BACT|nr:MAG: nucleotide exchange factor GrpE [Candidatus Shapirobacteria bacterium CG09_land_8_20_14_0_10_38_17]
MTKKEQTDKKLEKRVEELEEQWKRALADYQNLEKRIGKEREDFVRFANEPLIDKLLYVFDNLKRAYESFRNKGLKMVREQFWEVLQSEGVENIECVGEKFDPQLMDAVEMVRGAKEIIIEEVLPGYLYKGKCIRPAKVKVGKGKDSQRLKVKS